MKKKRFATSLIVMVFAIVALVVVGCNEINGGGWIQRSNAAKGSNGEKGSNGKKAHFSFNFKCECDDSGNGYGIPEVSGQLQFNDPLPFKEYETGVKFHGVADSVPDNICSQNQLEGVYRGSYTPQPRKLGPGGRFEISLKDRGEKGPSKGDYFKLSLKGGIYDGYELDGTLEGGNIQAHEAETSE